jgi:type II secretory ATPase GspE/PulE/Tfp pilus assembly ATPase PilB-like protein
MILVVGPTGSGKTTTLYALINEIRQEPLNIVTIEDPVEYEVDRITQVPVHEKAGLTFAKALRSILRQDPDVILVGEIRDSETAQTAFHAAMTGHLVLSTVHATDAVSALLRVRKLGLDRSMVASALIGIIGQRLVRDNCGMMR